MRPNSAPDSLACGRRWWADAGWDGCNLQGVQAQRPKSRFDVGRSSVFWCSVLGMTIAVEAASVVARLKVGDATTFAGTAHLPLVLRIHHMFWPVALVPLLALVRNRTATHVLLGISAGLILSDLLHHFVVLPLWVGNIGWHWP